METGSQELGRYFEEAVKHAPFGIAVVDGSNRWVYVNKSLAESFGYSLAEWPKDRTWWDFTIDADRDGDQASVNACMQKGGPNGYTMEKRYHRKNPGEFFWAELEAKVVRDADHNFEMFISYIIPMDRPAVSSIVWSFTVANWKSAGAGGFVVLILIAWGFGLITTDKAKALLQLFF